MDTIDFRDTSASLQTIEKAAEDLPVGHRRTPRPFGDMCGSRNARSVVECGCPLCTLHASLETASRERIPKGFRPKAQGCEERATLGARLGHVFNPERVVASGFPPFNAIAAQAATLSGLNMFSRGLSPRVARSSQPWAGGHNPFGIEDACKVQ